MFAVRKKFPEKGLTKADVPPPPPPAADEVQVKVTHAGICGTDFHIYQWDAWAQSRIKPPVTIGHECVGLIEQCGEGVEHLKPGDRVSAECHVVCGHCKLCRTGRAHICKNTSIIGVDRNGCFAECVNVPALNAWPVHPSISNHHAAIFDPVGNAMHCMEIADPSGKHVLITGAGAIGLIAVAIAKAYGALSITVSEPSETKRNLAEKLGADVTINPAEQSLVEHTRKTEAPDILYEMSGNARALNDGLLALDYGGTAVLLGIPARPVELDISNLVIFKGITLHGVVGRRMFNTWYKVEAFMRRNPHAMNTIISHHLPKEDFQQGFTLMEKGEAAKIVLKF